MIGILGGTFDPIHLGHINLAIEMLEKGGFKEIRFCPAKINPLKTNNPSADQYHRLEMLKLAIKRIPEFSWTDIEIEREGPSYTFDTLTELKTREPNKNFALIIGEDSVPTFHLWHKAEQLVDQFPIFVGVRSFANPPIENPSKNLKISQALQQGFIHTRRMDISSTEVRERLKKRHLYCGHLLLKEVIDYIYTNDLYLAT